MDYFRLTHAGAFNNTAIVTLDVEWKEQAVHIVYRSGRIKSDQPKQVEETGCYRWESICSDEVACLFKISTGIVSMMYDGFK